MTHFLFKKKTKMNQKFFPTSINIFTVSFSNLKDDTDEEKLIAHNMALSVKTKNILTALYMYVHVMH